MSERTLAAILYGVVSIVLFVAGVTLWIVSAFHDIGPWLQLVWTIFGAWQLGLWMYSLGYSAGRLDQWDGWYPRKFDWKAPRFPNGRTK